MQRMREHIDGIILSLLTADMLGGHARYFDDGQIDCSLILEDLAAIFATSDAVVDAFENPQDCLAERPCDDCL